MEIKIREKCDVCAGSGYISWIDHAGMIREDIHAACDGTGQIEKWIDVKDFLSLITDTQKLLWQNNYSESHHESKPTRRRAHGKERRKENETKSWL